ncbi:MAG: hypothetical protein LQ351_002134 [Letrouitia transgressa]|nr:MAG: hypothetical protein LQ351_002134 [Letrouitia transgressa]
MSTTNDGPIFFFMPHETPYSFLSQWYECSFTAPSVDSAAESMTFTTAEQYMMYHKAMLSHDDKIAEELMLTTSPKKQKALGRKVKGFDNVMWETNRERIVEEGNWNKFANAKDEVGLKQLLLDTGERELVEASPYDK